jgi:hypothetical protein
LRSIKLSSTETHPVHSVRPNAAAQASGGVGSEFHEYNPRGGNAVIVRHCAVFGVSREPVRTFKVWPVERYAQYERTVTVHYVKPGKRKKWGFHVVHDDLTYVTIEQDNYLVYDSRTEVPWDMEKFSATVEDMAKRRMARALTSP